MCLILFSLEDHPKYHLVFAANRDEFYGRPTSPADFREEGREFLAGIDLKNGGTWMGITRKGRLSAISNYRENWKKIEVAPSRGLLVKNFLTGSHFPKTYLEKISSGGSQYEGFNLLAGDRRGIYYYSNRNGAVKEIPPGVHGVSNHLLNTPWPKVQKGKKALGEILAGGNKVDPEDLFALLRDESRPPDESLPETGIGLEWERMLSPIFIVGKIYGTRSSTVVLWDRDEKIVFSERTYHPANGDVIPDDTRTFKFFLSK